MSPALTRDNLHLSRPTMADLTPQKGRAINCTVGSDETHCSGDLSQDVSRYVRDSMSDNTLRAYLSDLRHFESWGAAIPATDVTLADYLAAYAGKLSTATLARRLASISKAHASRGLPNPVKSELVRATMRGIRRTHGTAQRQAKPLVKEDLFAVLGAMGEGLKDARDRALLLVGFAGGFRRSELVAINVTDIDHVRQGIVVTIRRSKTDQEGEGRKVGIPWGRSRFCPVQSLALWLEAAGIEDGPLFRPVDRHGNVLGTRLSGEAVSLVIRQRVADAGLDPDDYSGHSLRAGLATSAAAAGVSSWKIRQQTGHASDAMLARYIRDGELFVDNAAAALL